MSKLFLSNLLVGALVFVSWMEMARTSSINSESPKSPEELVGEIVNVIYVPEDEITLNSKLFRRLAGTPAQLSAGNRDALLKKHNHYRSLTAQGLTPSQPGASYMEEMSWDSTLESMAMAQTKTCAWSIRSSSTLKNDYAAKNGKNGNGNIRQSLYQITGMAAGSQRYILSAVSSWYGEHAAYNYRSDACAKGRYCGLYLNIVWSSTRYVGCGFNVCGSATIVVCNYLNGRTWGKPYPKVTASSAPCSGCPAKRQTCSNFLCSGAVTGTPTSSPVAQPTSQPTQTLPPTRTGQVAPCKGQIVTLTMGMQYNTTATGPKCQNYKAAFTSVFTCVQKYYDCSVQPYTGYPGWARVHLQLQSSVAVGKEIKTKLYGGQLKAGMKSYLKGKGFVWGTR